jgi:hypothetical protein
MKTARQVGQVAMKARRSLVQLNLWMTESNMPSGSSAQPWGRDIAKSMVMVLLFMYVLLSMMLVPIT